MFQHRKENETGNVDLVQVVLLTSYIDNHAGFGWCSDVRTINYSLRFIFHLFISCYSINTIVSSDLGEFPRWIITSLWPDTQNSVSISPSSPPAGCSIAKPQPSKFSITVMDKLRRVSLETKKQEQKMPFSIPPIIRSSEVSTVSKHYIPSRLCMLSDRTRLVP